MTDWGSAFVGIAWTAPADADVAEYAIYRSEDGEAFSLLATIPSTSTTYTDEAVASGTTYGYRVTALDGSLNKSGPRTRSPRSPSRSSST